METIMNNTDKKIPLFYEKEQWLNTLDSTSEKRIEASSEHVGSKLQEWYSEEDFDIKEGCVKSWYVEFRDKSDIPVKVDFAWDAENSRNGSIVYLKRSYQYPNHPKSRVLHTFAFRWDKNQTITVTTVYPILKDMNWTKWTIVLVEERPILMAQSQQEWPIPTNIAQVTWMVKKGEDSISAWLREFREETGLDISQENAQLMREQRNLTSQSFMNEWGHGTVVYADIDNIERVYDHEKWWNKKLKVSNDGTTLGIYFVPIEHLAEFDHIMKLPWGAGFSWLLQQSLIETQKDVIKRQQKLIQELQGKITGKNNRE